MSRRPWLSGAAVGVASLLLAQSALAQLGGFGGPGMGGGARPPAGKKPKRDPKQPVTHAASGSGDDTIPKPTTAEPRLPAHPLRMSKGVRSRIGTGQQQPSETGRKTDEHKLKLYPPYFEETSGNYRFRTVFPFWINREKPGDSSSFYGLLYHRRRAKKLKIDALMPLYWHSVMGQDETTVVGPLGWHHSPDSSDHFLAPFFFQGKRKDGHYLTIPPLLTFLKTDKYGGRTIAGPMFCFWKGGQTCNPETADDIDYGVAPFYFAGKNEHRRYELAIPLLHYYGYTELDQSWLNVWGPFIRSHSPKGEAFHIAPLFFRKWNQDGQHITIPPLAFHYGYEGNSHLLVTPLFLHARGKKDESTFVTWGYARYRGRTELDMITPLYWDYRDPDTKLHRRLLFPFYYRSTSPRENSIALFPFYGHFRRYGLSESTWITPFFQHTTSVTGWQTNLHPIIYMGRDRRHSHTVVAPFFWDFVTPKSRATVGFPIYWRFTDERTTSQLTLNVYYREKKLRKGSDWEVHLFPLFSYGETPNGHWWKVLYGLAGYKRSGAAAQMRAFWIPITLSNDMP